ncbi:MAG TPA: FAD-dependent oxidoreductase [Ktedonobacteraceae bacterium]
MQTDFLILGGGCGGVDTAIELRKQKPDADITLVSSSEYLIYRPWLIYLPAQHRRLEQLQVSLKQVSETYRLRLIIDTVKHLEPEQHKVTLDSAESITYRFVVVATGAPADKEYIPGAASSAFFPCDVAEALRFRDQFLALSSGVVTVILAGERPGPGMEYAGWLAATVYKQGLLKQIQIQVVDHQDCMKEQLGPQAMERLDRFFKQKGARLISGQAVKMLSPDGVELENGESWSSALTAVVGPLRGVDLGMKPPIVDEQNCVQVQTTFQSPVQSDLFAVGDSVRLPEGKEVLKVWMMTRRQAIIVAQNLAAHADGNVLQSLDVDKIHKSPASRIRVLDVGGWAIFVLNKRVIGTGRWPLWVRAKIDRSYLKSVSSAPVSERA